MNFIAEYALKKFVVANFTNNMATSNEDWWTQGVQVRRGPFEHTFIAPYTRQFYATDVSLLTLFCLHV